jgi:hypothetical protein
VYAPCIDEFGGITFANLDEINKFAGHNWDPRIDISRDYEKLIVSVIIVFAFNI